LVYIIIVNKQVIQCAYIYYNKLVVYNLILKMKSRKKKHSLQYLYKKSGPNFIII